MCGRYSLGVPLAEIQELHGYNLQVGEWIDQDQFVPRHNISPRSQAPVLRRRERGEDGDNESPNEYILQTMKWGLVPHWSKHEDKSLSTVNARCENLVEGRGMWTSIKGRRRCAVICEGYYEWLKKGKEHVPYFTKHKSGKLMLLAGLYDKATLEGENEPLWTYTVVTTAANKELEWLHDRQPVILPTLDALVTWLDTSSHKWTPELTKLVEPYNDSLSPLTWYQVPKEVGKVGTESPTFIQPIAARKDGIQAMFTKQKEASCSTISPSKRKRTASPSPTSNVAKPPRSDQVLDKPSKIRKVDALEDYSEIEYINKFSPPDAKREQEAKHEGSKPAKRAPGKRSSSAKTESSPKVKRSPKKRTPKPSASSGKKITAFFHKS